MTLHFSDLWFWNYTTLKTRRGKESKCASQFYLWLFCWARAGQLSLCPVTALQVFLKVYWFEFPPRFESGELYHTFITRIYDHCELKVTITCETYPPCWKSSFPGLSKSIFLVTPFTPRIMIQILALLSAPTISEVPVLISYSEVRRI